MKRPREFATDDLGTLTLDGSFWRGHPRGAPVPIMLDGPDARALRLAAAAVAQLPAMELRARRYIDELSVPHTRLGKLQAMWVGTLDKEWLCREISPDVAAADVLLSGEPSTTLVFEIVGERDVLDVIFAGDVPVAWDAH